MRSLELFAGAGGLGIGVSRAGFKPAAVIEWDRWACDTIRENQSRGLNPVKQWPLVEGDVRDFDFKQFEGKVDLVSGGPPCQPFSMGGKHGGRLDARDMFPEAIRAVREARPLAFIIENVKGLTRQTFANYLEYVRLQLRYPELLAKRNEEWLDHLARLERYETNGRPNGLHYHIVQRVLNAADYGVPQKRERVFLVGFRADTGIEWTFPEPTHGEVSLLWSQWRSWEYWQRHKISWQDRPCVEARIAARVRNLKDAPRLLPWRTVRDALVDMPDPEFEPRAAARYLNHKFMPGARAYPGHTGSPLDEPAKALKAGDHGVPGGENMLRRLNGSVRYFSVRESARLQAFPDNYLFHGSWSETMRQLGNAVPVTLGEVVANSVRERLVT